MTGAVPLNCVYVLSLLVLLLLLLLLVLSQYYLLQVDR
jgi:hypothetical protein